LLSCPEYQNDAVDSTLRAFAGDRSEEKRDSSLRRPTIRQEDEWEEKVGLLRSE
jgi:hypothetical protein